MVIVEIVGGAFILFLVTKWVVDNINRPKGA